MVKLKMKLLQGWMEALYTAYVAQEHLFKPENEHEELLLEHVRELLSRLSKQLGNDQEKYTLTLTGTEAMAFLQFWMIVPVERGSLIQVVIHHIIQHIDKKSGYARSRKKQHLLH